MAVDADASLRITAEGVVALGCVEIVRDEEIEVAIVIDVEESATRAPAAKAHTGRACDVGEHAVAVVLEECVRTGAGYIQIDAAVVVDVTCASTHAVRGVCKAR